MLLSLPFDTHSRRVDDADSWSVWHERGLRELRWRAEREMDRSIIGNQWREFSLHEFVPARDAGDVCGVCGKVVTWVSHLPPLYAGGPPRCFANVVPFERYRDTRCVR